MNTLVEWERTLLLFTWGMEYNVERRWFTHPFAARQADQDERDSQKQSERKDKTERQRSPAVVPSFGVRKVVD